MNNRKLSVVFLILFVISAVQICGQVLSEELKILEPLVNKTWSGELKTPDGKRTLSVQRIFTPIMVGKFVKYQSSIPEVNSSPEGYFYWDRNEKKIAVLIVSKDGVYQKGYVSVADGIITIAGEISFPERSFNYRNTLQFLEDGKLVDRWFQNAFGEWRAGHVIELSAE